MRFRVENIQGVLVIYLDGVGKSQPTVLAAKASYKHPFAVFSTLQFILLCAKAFIFALWGISLWCLV